MSLIKKVFIWMVSTVLLHGCTHLTNPDGTWNSGTPRPLFLRNLPEGDDSYSQGLRDGCNDSMGLSGYGVMRLHEVAWGDSITSPIKYQYNYDANKAMEDSQYNLGASHGFSYCGIAANAVVGF